MLDIPRFMSPSSARGLRSSLLLAAVFLLPGSAFAAQDAEASSPSLGEQLDDLVPRLLEAYAVPGAAIGVISKDGSTRHVYGFADPAAGVPVTDDTAFNVASISKSVTAWGAMRLVHEGQIELDEAINPYLERWQIVDDQFDANAVTLRRLLSHTAGFSVWGVSGVDPGSDVPTLLDMLNAETDGVPDVRLTFEPGTEWLYSGGGYAVVQLLIEDMTGESFTSYMRKQVFEPLGMLSSSFEWNEKTEAIGAMPHHGTGLALPRKRFTATSAAGLQTTLGDILNFAMAVLGREGYEDTGILKRETVSVMLTPVEATPNADIPFEVSDYGLGFEIYEIDGVRLRGHGGQNDGWMAQMHLAPETGDALVILTNGTNGLRVIPEVQCIWLIRTFGRGCDGVSELPASMSTEQLGRFAGRFADEEGAVIELHVQEGHLYWRTDYGFDFALRPRSESEFFWVIGNSQMRFEFDDSGAATSFLRIRGATESRFHRVPGQQASE